ncbi:type II secretion system protein N [Glaciimonas sp. PCH181]|uniref:type II secretion system protein N n=1 Tax=Glaciimonas sp. PCH181 TaxID=2133943 RepID=UPI000D3B777B|nr:type II secretion system protein N [Glaciimonas sp. PCH181]PUA20209.1 hypothetical protein C7W93_10655 [Glaciimonas sp. PCH181]
MSNSLDRNIHSALRRYSKRLPGLVSLILFMLLCACIAYWMMQFIKPPVRAITAAPTADIAQIDTSQGMRLFGAQGTATIISNYQLTGVVVAKIAAESSAILSVDGKPPQAVMQGKELLPGVIIQEVHANYVLVSEGGISKRVMLPNDAAAKLELTTVSTTEVPAAPGERKF